MLFIIFGREAQQDERSAGWAGAPPRGEPSCSEQPAQSSGAALPADTQKGVHPLTDGRCSREQRPGGNASSANAASHRQAGPPPAQASRSRGPGGAPALQGRACAAQSCGLGSTACPTAESKFLHTRTGVQAQVFRRWTGWGVKGGRRRAEERACVQPGPAGQC